MYTLLALGRAAAPLAFDLVLKISLATGASLLAILVVGRRCPARRFGLVTAAFLVGAIAAAIPLPIRSFGIRVAEPVSQVTPAPPLPPEIRHSVADVRAVDSGIMTLTAATVPDSRPRPQRPIDWLGCFGVTWIVGVVLIAAYLAAGAFALRRMLAATTPCRDARILAAAAKASRRLGCPAPTILLSPVMGSACAAGLFRTAIVLPQAAVNWADSRMGSTLLHETMHVKRRDNLVTELLRITTALAWLSPVSWLALGAALRLREDACDEAVLGAGVAPATYAGDLLETARMMSSGTTTAASLVRRGDLERRIRAILSWSQQAVRPFARLRDFSGALVLVAGACVALLVGAAAPEKGEVSSPIWEAATSPSPSGTTRTASYSRCTFSTVTSGEDVELRVEVGGKRVVLPIPARALPLVLPLGPRARLARSFGNYRDIGTHTDYFNPGWDLRDTQSTVVAAAGGTVISHRATPDEGPIIEVDHGHGLRSRYGLGVYGSSSLHPGSKVAAGDPIGTLGPDRAPARSGTGKPDLIPILRFSVLAEVGGDQLVALDPAPLVFNVTANQQAPLATAVVNAAVRAGNREEVSRLIALGVGLNTIATDGTIPLEWTVLTQNVELARILIAAGAAPSARIGVHGREFTVADMARVTGNPDLISVVAPL